MLTPGASAGQDARETTDSPQPREVRLASLVTLGVPVPPGLAERAAAGESVSFAIRPQEGFQLVGSRSGTLDFRPGDLPILPITLAVGPDLTAGPATAVVVAFAEPSGATHNVSLPVRVAETSGLRASLAAAEQPAAPGSRLRLRYQVTNVANVADTVALSVETRLGVEVEDSPRLTLAPFETRAGEIALEVSPEAIPMPTVVILRVKGRTSATFATREVPVGAEDGFLASLVRVPTRLFVGSSVRSDPAGGGGPAYGLEAEGLLRPGVRLRVSSHSAANGANFAFRGLQYGPRFRAEIESRVFSIAGGEVFSRTASFAGHRLQGRGGTVEAGSRRAKISLYAARPTGEGGDLIEGYQYAAGADVQVGPLVAGARGVDESRRGELLEPDQRIRSAYVRLTSALPSAFGFDADVGWLGLENLQDARTAAGPAVALRSSYRDDITSVDLTIRRRPMLEGIRATAPNESRLAVITEAPGAFGLLGQLYRVEGAATRRNVSRITGGEGGVFVRGSSGRLQLLGRVRRSEGETDVEERTIEATLEASVGPGTIDARVEAGRSNFGSASSVLRSIVGYNLRSSRGWGRIGAGYTADAWTNGAASLDFTGAYRLTDRLEVHGSVATSLDGFDAVRARLAQLGAQFDVQPDLALLAGIERVRSTAGNGGAVRVSIGVRKGLPVPIPFPRRRAVQGFVFEDLDGDGQHRPNEPFVDGVRLTMGGITINTRRGHFNFPPDASRDGIQIELSSLGVGFLPPPIFRDLGSSQVQIPVHRAASLRVEAFFDLNADGVRDPTEMPLPDVAITVGQSARTGWRLLTGADGAAELGAIRPGSYVVSVDPQSLPRRAAAPGLVSMHLSAGEAGEVLLAIPGRTIALLDATPEMPEPDAAPLPEGLNESGGRK